MSRIPCFLFRFLFVFPAVIAVGIAISIRRYHVTLFIQFRNDHYHVILTAVYRLSQASSNKSAPVMMLMKVFTLLLSFSYVISDGQVRQVSFNLLNIEHVHVECHYYHDHDYEETFYYFYHKNQVNELICENYCRFP